MATQSTVIKKHPLSDLPSFKWDETDQAWHGRPMTYENQQSIPVAWFKKQIQDEGSGPLEIYYESPLFGKQKSMIRTPCVILGGDPDLITSLDDDTKKRFDAFGVIHAESPVVTNTGDDFGAGFLLVVRELLRGLPSRAGSPTEAPGGGFGDAVCLLKEKEKYVGGRVYIIQGEHTDTYPYYLPNTEGFTETEYSPPLCPEGYLGQCFSQESCTETSFEFNHSATGCTLEKTPGETISESDDIADLKDHIDRYEKLKIVAWFNVGQTEDITIPATCLCGVFDDSGLSCGPAETGEEPVVVGTTAGILETQKAKWLEIWGAIPADNSMISASPISNATIVQDMLSFFEAPRP